MEECVEGTRSWAEEIINAKNTFEKFRYLKFRQPQIAALQWIFNSRAPILALNAPTGCGKSLIGMTHGAMEGGVTYLCSTKMLQDQLEHEFPEAKTLKGRSNYPCLKSKFLTAADCTHSPKNPCPDRHHCPYFLKRDEVIKAPFKILNYSYFVTETNYLDDSNFSGARLIVCDEADVLDSLLINFIKLSIPIKVIDELNLGRPEKKTATSIGAIDGWKKWALGANIKITQRLQKLDTALENATRYNDEVKIKVILNKISLLDNIKKKMRGMLSYVDETWVWQITDRTWDFRPLWLTKPLAENFFFRHGKSFVLMSGTLPARTVLEKTLGIAEDKLDYNEVESSFPSKNRAVYVMGEYNLTNKTMKDEFPKITKTITDIINKHPDEKGIIHSISYVLADHIVRTCQTNGTYSRLITHDSKNRDEVIKKFRESDKPLILVSPSVARGLNLPDDLCRFIIWAKCPYLNLGDEVVSKRLYSGAFGRIWYISEALQLIIQGAGRGMRHENDRCITYVPDIQAKDLILRGAKLLPEWFRDAIKFGNGGE